MRGWPPLPSAFHPSFISHYMARDWQRHFNVLSGVEILLEVLGLDDILFFSASNNRALVVLITYYGGIKVAMCKAICQIQTKTIRWQYIARKLECPPLSWETNEIHSWISPSPPPPLCPRAYRDKSQCPLIGGSPDTMLHIGLSQQSLFD